MEFHMLPFVIQRVFNMIPVFLGATLLVFIVVQLAPGDFLDAKKLDPKTTPGTIERLERQYGLDQPLPVQYTLWIGNLLRGNLGYSFEAERPVIEVIAAPVTNSMILVIGNLILLYVIAIPVGIYSAIRQYSLGDKIISLVSYFFLGFPSFFLALIVIYGLLVYKWTTGSLLLPVGGMTSMEFDTFGPVQKVLDVLWHMIAPLIVTTIIDVAGFSRFMRTQMLEYLSQDYIRTARAKGLAERTVIYKHTLRNAITPFIASIGGLLPALIGGAGFVEFVFNWPGITPTLIAAFNSQDLYVFVSFSAISLVLLLIGNIISDLALAAVDPRIRYT
jgi:peptide/nickel transport system permease protein